MFYGLILISILGYSLQGTLLARYSRQIDPLSLAVYRNISLVVSMAPLLLFANKSEFVTVIEHFPLVILSGITGTIGLALMFYSQRFLAVGISSGFRQMAGAVFSLVLGMIFFNEIISFSQFINIIIPCFITKSFG